MIKYCALTTTSASLRSFVLPALSTLSENGYDITVSCLADEDFKNEVKGQFKFFPLDIERGFNLKKTIINVGVLYRFFKDQEFQMVEYGTENVAMSASLAAWLAHVPVRIYNHWGARFVGLRGISRFLSIWVERLSALFSTDIRQVSHLNAEMCVKQHIYSNTKVKVLGKGGTIGVDFSSFDLKEKDNYRKEVIERYGLNDEVFIYGFVGRIQRDKGINELIEAFRGINDDKCYLMLVGNVDEQNAVNDSNMEWAQNSDHVIFTGFTKETPKYVSAFDVLVHPTYREGFGMVLQEAAAVKTPIISTDIMGPGEFIKKQETGCLVPPKNVEALKDAMEYLYLNPETRKKYADRCYEYTKANFERSIMIDRIVEDRNKLAERL